MENPKEESKYPIGGYAPGYYGCTCVTCKTEFQGDKRAVQCEPCAVSMEAAKQYVIDESYLPVYKEECERAFINGAKWQQERMYNETIEFAEWIRNNPYVWNYPDKLNDTRTTEELFEQFKKK